MEDHPATTISGSLGIYWTTTPYPRNVAYILEYFLKNNGVLPENFELKVFEDSLNCDLPYYTEIKLSKYASILEDYGLLLAWNYTADGSPLDWIIHDDFRLFQSSISYKNHFIKKEYCCTITFTDYGKRFYDTLFGLAQADGIKLMLLNPKVGVSYDGEKWSAQNSTHTLYGEIATSGKTFSIKKILPKNEDLNENRISSELTDIDTGYSITI